MENVPARQKLQIPEIVAPGTLYQILNLSGYLLVENHLCSDLIQVLYYYPMLILTAIGNETAHGNPRT